MQSYLALARQIKKNREAKQRQQSTAVVKASCVSLDFPSFLSQYRPDLSYAGGYAFLREPLEYLLSSKNVVVQKGSQLGFTELLLTLSLFWVLCQSCSCFYMLPTDRDLVDFSNARFNPVLSSSPALASLIIVDNVHLKQAQGASLYLRAGMTRAGKPTSKIKSVPVKKLIIDEFDEIPEITLDIVDERLSGSLDKQRVKFSTPTASNRGIAQELSRCREWHYFLCCPACCKGQQLEFESNLDLERGTYYCKFCKSPWPHEQKLKMVSQGRWELVEDGLERINGVCVATSRTALAEGFQISQLYSPTVTAAEVAEKWHKADNELKKQTFFNHKLGLPYTAEGSKLEPALVDSRVDEYATDAAKIAGIDVSSAGLHYVVVCQPVPAGLVVCEAARVAWQDLAGFLRQRGVVTAVIDIAPERAKAREFAKTASGTWLAEYPSGLKTLFTRDENTRLVKIHRTEAIDTILARFRDDRILILQSVFASQEYQHLRSHVCAVSRKYREVRGEYEAFYEENGADHYLHALVYAEIASRLACSGELDQVVGNFLR